MEASGRRLGQPERGMPPVRGALVERLLWPLAAGWIGGFLGNALLGAAFSSPPIRAVLYHPDWQSRLFIDITPQRDIAVSVIGLVVLSGLHGVLYRQLAPSIPGRTWVAKGLAWGVMLWALYWLFQEWFIYVTLLKEPIALALVELAILLAGSLLEGMVIAGLLSGTSIAAPRVKMSTEQKSD